jgi:transmembrane sensor
MAAKDTQAVNEEAAAWFARFQNAHASLQDECAFQDWVEADPAHAVAYARVEAAWERAERLVATGGADKPAPAPARHADTLTRRAAAVALLTLGVGGIGGGFGLWALTRHKTYTTGIGERRTVALADGSRVVLNTSTIVAVAYSSGRRDLKLLAGEALFEVAKDPARPFIVTAGDAVVRAVGTAFNIRLRDQVTEVTVTEGVVAVGDKTIKARAPSHNAPHIAAGNGALVAPWALAKVALDPDALQIRTAWQQGLIELRGDTLEQAVAEFNRYSEAKLVISDPRIAAIRVGGAFGTTESSKFVKALEDGFNVRAVPSTDGNTYLISAS